MRSWRKLEGTAPIPAPGASSAGAPPPKTLSLSLLCASFRPGAPSPPAHCTPTIPALELAELPQPRALPPPKTCLPSPHPLEPLPPANPHAQSTRCPCQLGLLQCPLPQPLLSWHLSSQETASSRNPAPKLCPPGAPPPSSAPPRGPAPKLPSFCTPGGPPSSLCPPGTPPPNVSPPGARPQASARRAPSALSPPPRGVFGFVKRVQHKGNQMACAAKFIPLRSRTRAQAYRERDILAGLSHPLVTALLDQFETRKTLILILELYPTSL